jgi:predicted nuclease of predicted toxin-antitoxin system
MNFVLDENVSKKLVRWLKNQGHHAVSLHELNLLGIKNGSIAELAMQKNAIIVTCDRDFLQIRKELQLKSRIIFFHLDVPNYQNIVSVLTSRLPEFIEFLCKPGTIVVNEGTIEYNET